ncbi:AMP-binding protein [Microlunatus soli]|uniref:Fatty-acyl-CoA synthase n=1 Tax=Microlunatus soli TaxID=630515 RepID=A0A1H1SCY2_9ACTN|nr:AMP-binding protein [Microlunatus soli]SDS45733.1 fatty-acyl-CoA synthase [Microlunatus soli]
MSSPAAEVRAEPSYAAGPSEPALLDETIGANLERTVARFGDNDALVECATGRRWTYAEFDAAVNEVARGLLGLGVAKGDRLGIWAPNRAEWTLVQYATAKIGVILVNINPSYRSHELRYALNQSGCSTVISAAGFKDADYRAMLTEVGPDCPALSRIIYLGEQTWQDLIAAGADQPETAIAEALAGLTPDEPINIQYTSGTTGYPKGATLSHRNILNNGYQVTETIGFTDADRLVIPVPFYHCFGMVMGNLGCTTHGATMIIPSEGFAPDAALSAVQAERATALYGVPTMFIAELDHPDFADYDLSTLRTGIMAGSNCPIEVMKRCMNDMSMREVSIAYGMTETSPVSLQTLRDDDVERRTATVGRVHSHVEVKITDATGATAPRGEPGELCTKGYSVMLGYWNEPEKTTAAIDADGWMHTGDLGVMRADGYVNIVGRIKDMVIRGGENVYPREVEEFLYTHPDISDAQVVGVPDPKYGEELCVWIKLRAGAEPIDADALKSFCSGQLARYKIPRYVIITDDFPMTVTGKIRKVQMREESISRLGLQPAPETA